MNIGIMSMQRIFNYGSWMQAYGLKSILESLGNDVSFIDYHIGKPVFRSFNDYCAYYSRFIKHIGEEFLSDNRQLADSLPNKWFINEYNFKHHDLKSLLGGDLERRYDVDVDCLVVGSDEVFNCTQYSPRVGFSPELLGHYNHAKTKVSYAASFGNTTIEKIDAIGKHDQIKRYLSEFDKISVRDENSRQIINELLGIEPEVHLDPVLIWNFDDITKNVRLKAKEKYIIVYTYPNRLTKEEGNKIKLFAQKHGLRIYGINAKYDFLDRMIYNSPLNIIKYFSCAEYIVADTFHGTLFSIINRKPFVSIIRSSAGGKYGNNEKLNDVLTRLGLTSRIIDDINDLERKLLDEIDYSECEQVIELEKIHTYNYLQTLKKC